MIEEVTGLSLPRYLAERICGPLGLRAQLAVAVEEQSDVAPMVLIGDPGEGVDPWGPWYLESARSPKYLPIIPCPPDAREVVITLQGPVGEQPSEGEPQTIWIKQFE